MICRVNTEGMLVKNESCYNAVCSMRLQPPKVAVLYWWFLSDKKWISNFMTTLPLNCMYFIYCGLCIKSKFTAYGIPLMSDNKSGFHHTSCHWCHSVLLTVNVIKPTGHVMHQQFNIQQLYVLPTLYLCVLYLSENKQRLVPLTA